MDPSLSSSGHAPASISIQQAPENIEEISVSVRGPGMTPVEETFSPETEATALEIPTGSDREITVQAGPHKLTRVKAVTARGVQLSFRFYRLGDTGPAGGHIFFVAESAQQSENLGFSYMEAAPEDTERIPLAWAETDQEIGAGAQAQGTAIGTGRDNTQEVAQALGQETASAARLADQLSINGYDDWFVPSQQELLQMYENLYLEGIGGFAEEGDDSWWYWSSTEEDEIGNNDPGDSAYVVSFFDGSSFTLQKTASYNGGGSFIFTTMRAARSF
jgi:hypothetical protein